MEISISGIYSVPHFHFDLSEKFLKLLTAEVRTQILEKYPLPKVKSEELEIYICTDDSKEPSTVRKISKTDRGKYLTYHFWISYPKTVRRVTEQLFVDMDLPAFAGEFMFCLREALKNYGIPEPVFAETERTILEKLAREPEKFVFPFTEKDGRLRVAIRRTLDNFKQKHEQGNS